ncbi:MAG: hypothetical protein JO013_01575 [Alphaproteobacteria bacterium]|nr:hypothetical protein [Alphaproteobacteria bacterium]
MTDYANQNFAAGAEVETDGNALADCRFDAVTLVYRGGAHPQFDRCTFDSCGWRFGDAALRTIQFLQQVNASPGGQDFLADIFRPGAYITE